MGLFSFLSKPSSVLDIGMAPASTGLTSPYSSSHLASVAWADYFQGELGEVNRNAAMQVPAIKKARSILVAMIAALPLREYDGANEIDQPWLYTTKGAISPWHRMAYTIDDLAFYGWSLWAVERDGSGVIQDAARVPFALWSVDERGRVLVNGKAVSEHEVILFPAADEGWLAAGAPTITAARALARARTGRAQNPIPLTILQQVTDDELEDDEIEELVAAYSAARTSPTGAVAFADKRINVLALGSISSDFYETAWNDLVLDIGRLTSVPAALLDGSMSESSLTYSTSEGKRNELLDYSIGYYTAPIEARLSMDDVSPSGRRIRFDKSELLAVPNTPTATEVAD